MRIKEIRIEKNIRQKDLAALTGIASNTLSQYEHGKREPDIETLQRIADVLDVSVDDLLGRKRHSAEVPISLDESAVDLQKQIQALSPKAREKAREYIAMLQVLDEVQGRALLDLPKSS